MNNKYAVNIFWSDEDDAFIASCEEFPGLSGIGDTRDEALREAQSALDLMIETYLSKGIPLPEPRSVRIAA